MSDIGAETDSLGTGEEGSAAGSPATKKKHRQPKKKTLARLKAMKKNAMGSSESLGNSSQADSERGNEGKEEEKSEVKPDTKESTSKETGEKDPENSDESKPKPKPRRRFKELAQSGDEADRNSLSDFEGKHSPRPPSKPKPTTRRFGSTDSLKSSSSVDVENKSQGLNLPKKTASESSTDSAVTRSPRPGQWRGPIEPKVKETKPTAVALSDYSSDDGVETKKDEKHRKDKEQKGSNSTGNTSKERDSPGKSTTPAGSENKGNQDAKQVIGGSSSTGGGVPSGSSSDDDVVISTSKPKSKDKEDSETKEQKTEGNVSSPKSSHVNDRTGGVSDKVEMNRGKDSDNSDGSLPDMVPELEARLTAKLKMEDKGPKTSTPLKRQSSSLTSDTSSLVSVTSESSSEEDDLFLTNHKPGLNRLEPLKGAPNLPPIEGNASSQSLRTTIKTEFPVYSLYHGERSNSMPGLNAGHQLSRTESDMSVMSFQSVSALPMIQTRAARDRSYLLGSSMSSGALLGQDELERYFPDRRMTIFVGTWNMHGEKDLPEKIDDFLLPECCEYVQDMYIMGFQEGTPTRREWEIRMQETLGPTHVLFYSGTYGVLHLCVFIRRDLIWFCSVAEEDTVSTRAFSQIKTKGGLAVSFSFFGTTFLFINSHFTSGDNKAKERIADYSKICEAISLPKIIPVNQHSTDPNDCTSRFDCVFWFGDMNFRLDHERSKVEELIKHGHKSDYKELVAHDQLTNFMKKDEAFVGFKESQIRFPPTYKFDLNTDHYDTSPKLRVPSYTDRVLYKCKKAGDITPMHYSNVPSIKVSDHRPVYSVFEVKIRPGRDTIPLAAGQFDREVYIEANRRRAMQINVERKQSRICSIM
ncbi:inositol polyphosphate 5-phosphatase [Branchiostoma belcheri]|nr:inositol polyphosphate 5-phosphatase [Branchiostoma belcheri]